MSSTIQIETPTDTRGFVPIESNVFTDVDDYVEQKRYDEALREYENKTFLDKIEFIAKLERISSVDAWQHGTLLRSQLTDDHGIPELVIDCVIDQLHSWPYSTNSDLPF
mgnify:CR=1 FL=1